MSYFNLLYINDYKVWSGLYIVDIQYCDKISTRMQGAKSKFAINFSLYHLRAKIVELSITDDYLYF